MRHTKKEILDIMEIKLDIPSVLEIEFPLLEDSNIKTKRKKTKEMIIEGKKQYINKEGQVCFSDFGYSGLTRLESQRLTLFKEKGTTCVCCKMEASYFRKTSSLSNRQIEKIKDGELVETSFHLNLYGLKNNEEILFTKDHVIPLNKGGQSTLINYVTMCSDCNCLKKDLTIELYEFIEIVQELKDYAKVRDFLSEHYQ